MIRYKCNKNGHECEGHQNSKTDQAVSINAEQAKGDYYKDRAESYIL